MRGLLLCLIVLFGASCRDRVQERAGQEVEEKKSQVEAVTTATPKLLENQVVITGTLLCTSCNLKKQEGAKSQCSIYGCSYSLKVKKAISPKGKLIKNYVGKQYHILENIKSSGLLQKEYKGNNVIIVGKIYPDENIIEADFIKIAP